MSRYNETERRVLYKISVPFKFLKRYFMHILKYYMTVSTDSVRIPETNWNIN